MKRLIAFALSTVVGLLLTHGRVLHAQERDAAPEQTVTLGAGTFIGFAGADVAFLHLLGSYERRLSSNVPV